MPRAIFAAMTLTMTTALMLAVTAGGAAAQAVPGAADVGEYHERYANDANPYERSPRTGLIVEEALTGARPVPDTFTVEESVVMSPLPAVIPGTNPAARSGPRPATGLTPGAPLGSGDLTDRKMVAGQAR